MKFLNTKYLKPIVEGYVCNIKSRMLIDTGADYVILNVPKYAKQDNGEITQIYTDKDYDTMINDKYGMFVVDIDGNQIRTVVHGFGDISNECRLLFLKSLFVDGYIFNNCLVLLDEHGFATNQDVILGTACLRNFIVSVDYLEKEVTFTKKIDPPVISYRDILASDSNIISIMASLSEDIYLYESEGKSTLKEIHIFS